MSVYNRDPLAMPTQSKIWADAVLKGTGYQDTSRYYLFADGREAVLPVFSRNIVPHALTVLNSPPRSWGFGGVLSSASHMTEHLEAILDDLAGLGGAAISIRPNPLHTLKWLGAAVAKGWSLNPKMAHVLNLEDGFETVWKSSFSGNTRSKIRRAEKNGVTVEIGNSSTLIADFEHLFRRSITRWARRQNEFGWLARLRGHLRDSSKKFRIMADCAKPLLQVAIASHGERPVAGSIFLLDRNAHYTRGAMDERLIGSTYANYLLHARIIERACERGCRHYHMGETGRSNSLARFKAHFGAIPVSYAELWNERLPVFSVDRTMRSGIKRLIGFSDA